MSEIDAPAIASFAKVFELSNGNQLAAYYDPLADTPTLIIATSANGVRAQSVLTVAGEATPPDAKQAVVDAAFALIDTEKAKELFSMLISSLQSKAPQIAFLQELRGFTHGREAAFAKLFDTPTGALALLLCETDDCALTVVTAQTKVAVSFDTPAQLRHAFDQPASAQTAWPLDAANALGLYPKATPRGPRP